MIGALKYVLKSRSVATRSSFRLKNKRSLLTLAIESSCDDTSVAILEKHDSIKDTTNTTSATLHFHDKITSNNLAYRGVHPLIALDSHEQNLAELVRRALQSLIPSHDKTVIGGHGHCTIPHVESPSRIRKPDFITVTRGPGMRSNLSAGLNTAKGLAVAWQIPLLAVNHMQAHALTPRLVSAMASEADGSYGTLQPTFPYLSLLVSGGHTMFIHSKTLTEHPTIATTADIAIGDAIDKIAREILPLEVLATSKSTMYGAMLENFAFPNSSTYDYIPPRTREQELTRRVTHWGWSFGPPLAETKSGAKSRALEYSFTGLCSSAKRIVDSRRSILTDDERRDLAREAMRVAFEHLASRVVLWLQARRKDNPELLTSLHTLVVSGGVAANKYLRHIMRAFLNVRGFDNVALSFPPVELCTDNAAMIAWTGIEMFEAGYTSSLSCQSLRKWSLDPSAEDGGILGVPGWLFSESSIADFSTYR